MWYHQLYFEETFHFQLCDLFRHSFTTPCSSFLKTWQSTVTNHPRTFSSFVIITMVLHVIQEAILWRNGPFPLLLSFTSRLHEVMFFFSEHLTISSHGASYDTTSYTLKKLSLKKLVISNVVIMCHFRCCDHVRHDFTTSVSSLLSTWQSPVTKHPRTFFQFGDHHHGAACDTRSYTLKKLFTSSFVIRSHQHKSSIGNHRGSTLDFREPEPASFLGMFFSFEHLTISSD